MLEGNSTAQHALNAVRNYDRYATNGRDLSLKDANPFGIALKYILWNKRVSFSEASRKIGYKTPQSFNYLLNHRSEKDFYEEELSFICKKLDINEQMFINLSKEIKKILVNNEK